VYDYVYAYAYAYDYDYDHDYAAVIIFLQSDRSSSGLEGFNRAGVTHLVWSVLLICAVINHPSGDLNTDSLFILHLLITVQVQRRTFLFNTLNKSS
jgi:hypothetical protein